jgi:hypothetical protein
MNNFNYYTRYQELVKLYYEEIITDYNAKIDKARPDGKSTVHHNFGRERLTQKQNEINSVFHNAGSFMYEIQKIYNEDSTTELESIFNRKINEIKPDKRLETVKLIAEYEACTLMFQKWHKETHVYIEYYKNKSATNKENTPQLKWKGKNETEFVHFIYALYDAGYLNNDTNEKTKLIEQVAKAFNFSLTKNWQSKRSKSIAKSNNDYLPEIIKKLTNAFLSSKQQRETRNKKISST